MHEYSVIGHPREKITFVVAFISIVFGPIVISFFESLYSSLTGQVLSLTVAVMSIFSLLYFAFNKWGWKVKLFSKLFSFPNLNGTWVCVGETLDSDGSVKYEWAGNIEIEQTWDSVLITLKTKNSSSTSLSLVGGIRYIPRVGYKLSYSYNNNPKVGEPELEKHEGFCELTFTIGLDSAEGYYFNGPGRFSYGRMNLTRG